MIASRKSLKYLFGIYVLLFHYDSSSEILTPSSTSGQFERSFLAILEAANSGDVIVLPEGTFKLKKSISIFTRNLTIGGSGEDTVLDFVQVAEGAQAILVRGSGVTIKNLHIKNAPGDGLVARGVTDFRVENIRVDWPNKKHPGGYGIYPVQSRGVLVKNASVSGASEAGVYVGQTKDAMITGCKVRNNVIGIDIENSENINVVKNVVVENSIGVSVIKRPYLLNKNSQDIRITNNIIQRNNLENFGIEGSIANQLSSGVGISIIASHALEIEDNQFDENHIADVHVASFKVLGRSFHRDGYFKHELGTVKLNKQQFEPASKQLVLIQEECSYPNGEKMAHLMISPCGAVKSRSNVCFSDDSQDLLKYSGICENGNDLKQ